MEGDEYDLKLKLYTKKCNYLKLYFIIFYSFFFFYLETASKGCSVIYAPINSYKNYRQVPHLHYIFQIFQVCQTECSLDSVSDSLINCNGNVTKCSCL